MERRFKKIALASLLLLAPIAAHADAPAQSKQEFCQKSSDLQYFKDLATDPQNQIAFTNAPVGLFHGGICWWHSELQRSSLFLAVYRPDLPPPTSDAEVIHLFEAIMKKKAVVEIPGYRNFEEFSGAWQDLLTRLLERWQITQGVLGFGWIDGLGTDRVSASSLARKVKKLYNDVMNKNHIVFSVLKFPGLEAHAWLIVNMTQRPDGGYDLSVLDSNLSGLQTFTYTPGMTSFTELYGEPYVPRIYRESDYSTYAKRINAYCSGKVDPTFALYKMRSSDSERQPQVGDACEGDNGYGTLVNIGASGDLECSASSTGSRKH